MKYTTILIFFISSLEFTKAQIPEYGWAGSIGKGGSDYGYQIYSTQDGFIYCAGTFRGSNVDFNIDTTESDILTSGDYYAGFISKYNSDGTFIWAFELNCNGDLPGAGTVSCNSLTTDLEGNIYVTGSFQGTTDFDPGPGETIFTSIGTIDFFLAKYSGEGALIWAMQAGYDSHINSGNYIQTDNNGFLYVTGSIGWHTDYNPDPFVENFPVVYGGDDILIAKYTIDGDYVWAIGMGGTTTDYGYSLALDESGNIFAGGIFHGSADLNPDPVVENLVYGGGSLTGGFIAKYSNDGEYIWSYDFDTPWYGDARSVAVDHDGNVYATGTFTGEADFNPDPVATNIFSSDTYATYILKYTNDGNYQWVEILNGTGLADGYCLNIDNSDNIIISGIFTGEVDFNPDDLIENALTTISGTEGYIAGFKNDGTFEWAFQLPGTSSAVVYNITNDESDNIYATGWYKGTADFNPSPLVENSFISQGGEGDIFLAKYIPVVQQSIQQAQSIYHFNIFPNPAQNEITISPIPKSEETIISIYKSDGTLISKIISPTENEVRINLSGLARGTYLVRLSNDTESYSEIFEKL